MKLSNVDQLESRNMNGRSKGVKVLKRASVALTRALDTLNAFEFEKEIQLPTIPSGIDFYDEVRRFEIALIVQALKHTHGHQKRAALLLGLRPTTLNEKIKVYHIETTPPYLDSDASSSQMGK